MAQIFGPDLAGTLAAAKAPLDQAQQVATTQAQQIQNQIEQAKVPYAGAQAQTALQQAQQTAQTTTIANHVARASYLANKAADITALPNDQQENAYKQLLPELKSMGYDTSKMDSTYTPNEQTFFKQLATTAPQDATARQNQADMAKQALVNLGTANVATITAQGRIAAEQGKIKNTPSAFDKADQQAFSKEISTLNDSVDEGQQIAYKAGQVKSLIDKAGIPLTGAITGSVPIMLTPKQVQTVGALIQQMGLDKVKTFHLGRITQYEFGIIMNAYTGGRKLDSSVVYRFMNDLQGDYTRQRMQQDYYNQQVNAGNTSASNVATGWQNYYQSKVNKWTPQNITTAAKKLDMTPDQLVFKLRGQGWEVPDYVAPKQ